MDGNVTAYFPNIPIYQDVAMFFLTLMYKVPFVYSIFGIDYVLSTHYAKYRQILKAQIP